MAKNKIQIGRYNVKIDEIFEDKDINSLSQRDREIRDFILEAGKGENMNDEIKVPDTSKEEELAADMMGSQPSDEFQSKARITRRPARNFYAECREKRDERGKIEEYVIDIFTSDPYGENQPMPVMTFTSTSDLKIPSMMTGEAFGVAEYAVLRAANRFVYNAIQFGTWPNPIIKVIIFSVDIDKELEDIRGEIDEQFNEQPISSSV